MIWKGDSSTATGLNTTHTYSNAGTYTVTLVATDSQGAQDTETKTLSVTGSTSSSTR